MTDETVDPTPPQPALEPSQDTAAGKDALGGERGDQGGIAVREPTSLTRWIVELSTIFGVAGFLGSILLNGYVFTHWGLSFLQVATLSDVVMSGLQLSLDIASLSLFALVGYVAGRRLFLACGRSGPIWERVEKVRTNFVTALVVGSIPLTGYVLWRGVGGTGNLPVLYGIAAGVGFAAGNVNTSRYWGKDMADNAAAVVVTTSVLGLFAYAYVQAFLSKESVIGGGLEGGFVSTRRQEFTLAGPQPACPRARVLWIGERSIVARCLKSRRIILLDHSENTFIS